MIEPISVVSEVSHKRMRSSWTLWFNGVVGTLSTILMTLDLTDALSALPTIKEYLRPEIYQGMMIALTITNVWLRIYRTTSPILRKGASNE
jgi:hypothetical protein